MQRLIQNVPFCNSHRGLYRSSCETAKNPKHIDHLIVYVGLCHTAAYINKYCHPILSQKIEGMLKMKPYTSTSAQREQKAKIGPLPSHLRSGLRPTMSGRNRLIQSQ